MIKRTGSVLAAVVAALLLASSPVYATGVDYSPPVSAPIGDHFRAPATLYGPGNRGLEYVTQPGTDVRAAGDGIVAFAGVVLPLVSPHQEYQAKLADVDLVTVAEGRFVHTLAIDEIGKGHPGGALEEFTEIEWAHFYLSGDIVKFQRFVEVGEDVALGIRDRCLVGLAQPGRRGTILPSGFGNGADR